MEISKFFYSHLKTETFKNFMFHGPTWTADQPGLVNKKFEKRIYSHAKPDKKYVKIILYIYLEKFLPSQ